MLPDLLELERDVLQRAVTSLIIALVATRV
jgi:hypothetical protein